MGWFVQVSVIYGTCFYAIFLATASGLNERKISFAA